MAITQEVVVLNDFGDMRVEERRRTTSAGTNSRQTVTFTGEPIVHDYAGIKLNRRVAEAIAALIKRQIAEITEKASEATILKRKYAKAAFARGAAWAVKRYAGGRIGALPPEAASEDRMFNDSGRLAAGIAVMQNTEEQSFTINVAANRLDTRTFAAGQFDAMINRLRQLVPALRGGVNVLQDPAVREAIEQSTAEHIVATGRQGSAAYDRAWATLRRMGWNAARGVLVG